MPIAVRAAMATVGGIHTSAGDSVAVIAAMVITAKAASTPVVAGAVVATAVTIIAMAVFTPMVVLIP